MEMSHEWNLVVGIISSIVLTIMGYFLKRVITESDKVLTAHQEKLKVLADKIGDLTKEHVIMNERLNRLLKIDEQIIEHDKAIFRLTEHEKQHRQRYHDLANYINNIMSMMATKGMDVDNVFKEAKWNE